jgi:hypothetical protein
MPIFQVKGAVSGTIYQTLYDGKRFVGLLTLSSQPDVEMAPEDGKFSLGLEDNVPLGDAQVVSLSDTQGIHGTAFTVLSNGSVLVSSLSNLILDAAVDKDGYLSVKGSYEMRHNLLVGDYPLTADEQPMIDVPLVFLLAS